MIKACLSSFGAITMCVLNRLSFLIAVFFLMNTAVVRAESDPVLFALSSRHMTTSPVELEKLAGGRDLLIERLLVLRTQEQPPFVGVRAESLLLAYADQQQVEDALTEDLQSADRKGLARVITIRLSKVAQEEVRLRLAKVALTRASKESDFAPYARTLTEDKNAEISRLARETLQ